MTSRRLVVVVPWGRTRFQCGHARHVYRCDLGVVLERTGCSRSANADDAVRDGGPVPDRTAVRRVHPLALLFEQLRQRFAAGPFEGA
jgi:hypothetical protein